MLSKTVKVILSSLVVENHRALARNEEQLITRLRQLLPAKKAAQLLVLLAATKPPRATNNERAVDTTIDIEEPAPRRDGNQSPPGSQLRDPRRATHSTRCTAARCGGARSRAAGASPYRAVDTARRASCADRRGSVPRALLFPRATQSLCRAANRARASAARTSSPAPTTRAYRHQASRARDARDRLLERRTDIDVLHVHERRLAQRRRLRCPRRDRLAGERATSIRSRSRACPSRRTAPCSQRSCRARRRTSASAGLPRAPGSLRGNRAGMVKPAFSASTVAASASSASSALPTGRYVSGWRMQPQLARICAARIASWRARSTNSTAIVIATSRTISPNTPHLEMAQRIQSSRRAACRPESTDAYDFPARSVTGPGEPIRPLKRVEWNAPQRATFDDGASELLFGVVVPRVRRAPAHAESRFRIQRALAGRARRARARQGRSSLLPLRFRSESFSSVMVFPNRDYWTENANTAFLVIEVAPASSLALCKGPNDRSTR